MQPIPGPFGTHIIQVENLALHAAAPEMLRALKEALHVLKLGSVATVSDRAGAMHAALSAINKAEGK